MLLSIGRNGGRLVSKNLRQPWLRVSFLSTKAQDFKNQPRRPRRSWAEEKESHLQKRPAFTPYDNAVRASSVASEGDILEAIEMVKKSPIDSQTTAVWNSLVKQAVVAQRFKIAYSVFTEMKRRGFRPNLRTYHTLLSGYARDTSDFITDTQLERARSVYTQFREYAESTIENPEDKHQISNSPVNEYLGVLEKAGRFEEMLEVFSSLPSSGPLAADEFTFTRLIGAVNRRKRVPEKEIGARDSDPRESEEALLLWDQMVAASKRLGFSIDAHAVSATLFALSKGSPKSRETALSIIHDFVGFPKMGTEPPSGEFLKIPLSPKLLSSVLEAAFASKKCEEVIHYGQTVISSKEYFRNTTYEHVIKMLKAHCAISEAGGDQGAKSLERIEWMIKQYEYGGWRRGFLPHLDAYNLALQSCWRCGDWETAFRLFEVMTGSKAREFMFPIKSMPSPISNVERPARNITLPDAQASGLLVGAAIASGNVEVMRQCLRMLCSLGQDHLFLDSSEQGSSPSSNIKAKNLAFQQSRLASSIADMIKKVEKTSHADEMKIWRDFRDSLPKPVERPPRNFDDEKPRFKSRGAAEGYKPAFERKPLLKRGTFTPKKERSYNATPNPRQAE